MYRTIDTLIDLKYPVKNHQLFTYRCADSISLLCNDILIDSSSLISRLCKITEVDYEKCNGSLNKWVYQHKISYIAMLGTDISSHL